LSDEEATLAANSYLDMDLLLHVLQHWKDEAMQAGRPVRRIAVAFAGRPTRGTRLARRLAGQRWWRLSMALHVAPVASTSLRPLGKAGSRAATPVVIYGISVWVGWADGDPQRQVRLDTEQVGGAG
jgi:hypothetical protein